MNKTTLIGIVIAIIVLGGIVWFARPKPTGGDGMARPGSQSTPPALLSPNSDGMLSAEETSFDFGTISMAAGKVEHAFKIKNASSEPLVIEKIYTSCMCTTAALVVGGKRFGPYGMPGHGFIPKINEKMDAGEEAIIEVVFDPAAHGPAGVGRIQRTITIENNAGQPLELGFTALVTP